MANFDLNELFTYHSPVGNQPERYNHVRSKAKEFAQAVLDCTEPGADQSAAIRQIREATMTANAAIALGPDHIEYKSLTARRDEHPNHHET